MPEPFVVRLDTDLIDAIPDGAVQALARSSSSMAFGSKKLPPGFSTWPRDRTIPRDLIGTAAEIFCFDALIQNPDRRPENPNCLFNGATFAIFDHELAFLTEGVVGWRPPWQPGALAQLARPTAHLFWEQLRGKAVSLARLAGAWEALTDERLAQYKAALPDEWYGNGKMADAALSYVAQVRDNIQAAVNEVMRVLK